MVFESLTNTTPQTETEFGWSLLASTLAHEIRNPLQSIRLQLDAAKRGASVLSTLQTISENITRLESVVDRVQRLSQKHSVQAETILLKDLIDTTLSSVSFWLSASGIHVNTHFHWEGEALCEGDSELLQQVLLNLLMNAIQSMPTEGTLSVSVLEELDYAAIEIEDRGEGISPETLKLVGTPFFTTKPNGNGLGFAFCKTIAALHGGSLEIESKKGVGTKVTLRIPKSLNPGKETSND